MAWRGAGADSGTSGTSGALGIVVALGAAGGAWAWARWWATTDAAGFALGVGAVASLLVCAVFARCGGGVFGTLFLAGALLMTVALADQAAGRDGRADCAVRKVETSVEHSFGEGAPSAKEVHRIRLDCAGGGPSEVTTDRPAPAVGDRLTVAWDPHGRLEPVLPDELTPWPPGVAAVFLLGCAVVAVGRRGM
ncbi:hypothetical protein ACN20G_30730 (plasmid) [Streptomyces sp. BI20]|uniref:hypothetical protein n=1 Tax=Streptomyces sp. BI20 TaxID=3403460 RepID=UPI003C7553E6